MLGPLSSKHTSEYGTPTDSLKMYECHLEKLHGWLLMDTMPSCKEVPVTWRTIQRNRTWEQIGKLSLVSTLAIDFSLQISYDKVTNQPDLLPWFEDHSAMFVVDTMSLILSRLLKQSTFHYQNKYSNDFLKFGNPGVSNWSQQQPCSTPFCLLFQPTPVPAPLPWTAQSVLFPSFIMVSFQQTTRVSFSATVWQLSFYYLT